MTIYIIIILPTQGYISTINNHESICFNRNFLCRFNFVLIEHKICLIVCSFTKHSFFSLVKLEFFIAFSYLICDFDKEDCTNLLSFYF